jgi:hypothetical protein
MRSKSYEFNNEHPNNDSIIRDIRIMAGEGFEVDLSAISTMRSDYRQGGQQRQQRRGKQQRNNNGRKMQKGGKNHSRHNNH